MYDLSEIPIVDKDINELVEKAIADPKVATLLRKVFQEAEHLAYRKAHLESED